MSTEAASNLSYMETPRRVHSTIFQGCEMYLLFTNTNAESFQTQIPVGDLHKNSLIFDLEAYQM